MNRQHRIRMAAAVVAVTLAGGLTACAASQSVADACSIYRPLADEFKGGAANEDLAGATWKLKDVQSKITNDQVKPLVDKLVTYMTAAASAGSTNAADWATSGDAIASFYTLEQLCPSEGH